MVTVAIEVTDIVRVTDDTQNGNVLDLTWIGHRKFAFFRRQAVSQSAAKRGLHRSNKAQSDGYSGNSSDG